MHVAMGKAPCIILVKLCKLQLRIASKLLSRKHGLFHMVLTCSYSTAAACWLVPNHCLLLLLLLLLLPLSLLLQLLLLLLLWGQVNNDMTAGWPR